MRTLLLSILLTAFLFTNAQTIFCPPGAEWHYSFGFLGMPPNNGNKYNEQIKYERDSVIGGETVKVLSHTRFFNECNDVSSKLTLIKQSNDTVYFNNANTQCILVPKTWQILFVYSAGVGDSWQTFVCEPGGTLLSHTFTAVSTTTINENGFNLKQINLSCQRKIGINTSVYNYTATVTERFGGSIFLGNFIKSTLGFCDADYFESILCYKDNAFGLKQFTSKDCNYQLINGLKENSIHSNEVSLFPNPASNNLNLYFSTPLEVTDCRIQILNSMGQIVKQSLTWEQITNNKELKIDVSDLPNGIYTVIVKTSSNETVTKKLVISNQ